MNPDQTNSTLLINGVIAYGELRHNIWTGEQFRRDSLYLCQLLAFQELPPILGVDFLIIALS
jgi:hypothetical protein